MSQRPRPRTLVLGATGHLGQAVVRELLAHGYPVTAATRQSNPESLSGLGVAVAQGDADAPGQLEAWVQGHELVVDAAAPYPLHLFVPRGAAEREPFVYARRRTQALLEAVARHRARLGFISSFTTLPRADAGLASLEARWRRRSHPYFIVKQLMEEQVLEAARGGLPAVIVNPTACLGPWDWKPPELCLIPQLLSGRLLATARHPVNVIDVRDVAAGLRAALEAECYGEPIPLSGHDVFADELARRICELGGADPPPLRASARLGVLALLGMEAAWALRSAPPPAPALAALLLWESGPRTPSSAQQRLGLRVRPLEETLMDSIAWYRQRGCG